MKLSADAPVVPMSRKIETVILFTQNIARFNEGQFTFTAVL